MQGTMKRSTTVQAVLKQLRHDIVTKKLNNHMPVTELQYAEAYGCSRAALRGALTVLEQEGLIQVLPNGTKRICSLSIEDINNIYELRSYVECSAAEHILRKETIDVSKLFKVLEDAKRNSDFVESDAMFHETLVSMSKNKVLIQTWKTFMPVAKEFFILNFSYSEKLKDSLEERHILIAKLLLEKDKKVIDVLKKHIEEARNLSVGERIIQ